MQRIKFTILLCLLLALYGCRVRGPELEPEPASVDLIVTLSPEATFIAGTLVVASPTLQTHATSSDMQSPTYTPTLMVVVPPLPPTRADVEGGTPRPTYTPAVTTTALLTPDALWTATATVSLPPTATVRPVWTPTLAPTRQATPLPTQLPTLTPLPTWTSTPIVLPSAVPTVTPTPLVTPALPQEAGCVVTTPPPQYALDPFYQKFCLAYGIPIISSAEVPDLALKQTWLIVNKMLAHAPVVRHQMVLRGTRIGIIGAGQVTTDMPEYRDLYLYFPETDWNTRTRGLGATTFIRLSSAAEENILCYTWDAYRGESIMVHELAHTIKDMGVQFVDPSFTGRLEAAYLEALAVGRWANTYAISNPNEYWAEGVQSFFDVNIGLVQPNGIHNHVDTREELRTYDPPLYALITEIFSAEDPWIPDCP